MIFERYWCHITNLSFPAFDRYRSPITKYPFHIFWRCWAHIQDFREFPFHVLRKILVPYSIFSRIYRTDLQELSSPVLSQIVRSFDVQCFEISENISENDLGFFLNHFESFGVTKIKCNWFWESWSHPPGSNTMKMRSFRVHPKWILKVTSPKCFYRVF